jgi:hypothetical protein
MKQMIKTFLNNCYTHANKPRLLQPFAIPSAPWELATMDLINGLPPSLQFNCLLVVVDKLAKYAHFTPPFVTCTRRPKWKRLLSKACIAYMGFRLL